jgi:ATP-binding cassette subfamily F protein 3
MSCAELDPRRLDLLLRRYGTLQQQYDGEAHGCEARAQKVLIELGFKEEDFGKSVRSRSGGFQVRLTLARMLLQNPDLLLLDEPTNYLDIHSIEWLQEYLRGFGGAFVMIAHDRYLLDGLVDRVWAIEGNRVLALPGNYSDYLEGRELREAQQHKKYEEQQALIKRTEKFIAQFKGRKDTAKRAMSRRKMLDKLELVQSVRDEQVVRFRFPEADQAHGRAFQLKGVGMRFGSTGVFRDADLSVKGGERIGLFGQNGAGKTTLLRIIARRLEPTEGQVWWSAKTSVAYYEQGAEDELDESLTVLETVTRVAVGYTESQLKGILGTFLFRGDAIEKKVRVLSGGERSRLAIIEVLVRPSNLLVQVLFDAIERYERTVVFAAHDRFMLDRLADKTVRVEGGRVELFPGNYSYAQHRPMPVRGGSAHEEKPRINTDKHRLKNRGRKPKVDERMAVLERRLAETQSRYEQARAGFDLNRARDLAQGLRGIEEEIARLRAERHAGDDADGVPEAWT